MSEDTTKSVGIDAVEGGFILNLDGQLQVVTSLNKAMKLVREFLGSTSADSAE